jgi:hypothetical protein
VLTVSIIFSVESLYQVFLWLKYFRGHNYQNGHFRLPHSGNCTICMSFFGVVWIILDTHSRFLKMNYSLRLITMFCFPITIKRLEIHGFLSITLFLQTDMREEGYNAFSRVEILRFSLSFSYQNLNFAFIPVLIDAMIIWFHKQNKVILPRPCRQFQYKTTFFHCILTLWFQTGIV